MENGKDVGPVKRLREREYALSHCRRAQESNDVEPRGVFNVHKPFWRKSTMESNQGMQGLYGAGNGE